jgi:hypothetical protein
MNRSSQERERVQDPWYTPSVAAGWQLADVGNWDRFTASWAGVGVLAGIDGERDQGVAWEVMAKGMVGWDDWATDPGKAAGVLAFNVGSLLVPGAGEAAAGADAARGASLAAEAAGATARLAAEAEIDGLPGLKSGIASGAKSGYLAAFPKVSELIARLRREDAGLGRRHVGPGAASSDDPALRAVMSRPGQIANKLGVTTREVKVAIHKVKQYGLPRDGPTRNPDVVVNTESGEVYVQLGGGYSSDSIGNIFEYLEGN